MALAAPPLILASTWIAFQLVPALSSGLHVPFWAAFAIAYSFYLVFWCFLFAPLIVGRPVFQLFRPGKCLSAPGWLCVALLLIPVLISAFQALPRLTDPGNVPLWAALLAGMATATLNAPAEELLWRGVYIRLLGHSSPLGLIYYSTAGFALWHLSPLSVVRIPNPPGRAGFILLVAVTGLIWGWVANKSQSLFGATLSHWAADVLVNAAIVRTFPG
jgi:membrane protease YdiL (CAAX protease family)